MKKALFIFLLFVFPSLLPGDFKIMGGADLSKYRTFWEPDNIQWKHRLGFFGGIGLEKKLSHNVLLEFDFMYFQKGSRFHEAGDPLKETKYRLNVLSVPILLRIRNRFAYGSSYFVVGGIELCSIFSHKADSGDLEPVDVKDQTSFLDYGLVFGGGYEIELQEDLFFFIESRYHIGLKNILIDPSESESWKTRAVLVMIGLRS